MKIPGILSDSMLRKLINQHGKTLERRMPETKRQEILTLIMELRAELQASYQIRKLNRERLQKTKAVQQSSQLNRGAN